MNLKLKELIAKMLSWAYGHFDGAATLAKTYGAVTSVTPSASGWLVAHATTNAGQTIPPVIRIQNGDEILAEQTGITYSGSSFYASCYVKKGTTYTIKVYRSTLQNVRLYL